MGRRRTELTDRRVEMGYTQEQLAHEMQVTVGSVASWERGDRRPSPRHRKPLAKLLKVDLVTLNQMLDPTAPRELPGHDVPSWLGHFGSLITSAGGAAEFDPLIVPGLLQTRDYAAAVERSSEHGFTDKQILDRVEFRATRQESLHRESDPLELTAILPEWVLTNVIGSREIMVDQLDHLIELAQRPNVDLRILDGAYAGAAVGSFLLLTGKGAQQPFMAVTFTAEGAAYIDVDDRILKFVRKFEHLQRTALSPADTIRRLKQIRHEHFKETR